MKILLVDDDESFVKMMGRFLRDRGHVLITASDGVQALDAMAVEDPELVISDIQMPNMDGVELLRRISERSPDTPVVLLTGYSDANKVAAAFEHGAYGFLEKPVNLEALLAGIRRLDRDRRGNTPGEATATSAGEGGGSREESGKMCVLIVDDQPGIRQFTRDAREEYTVCEAACGDEALAVIERERVDLVITDIKMQPMDGMELRKELEKCAPDLPVMALSGFFTAKDLAGHGFTSVIEKPVAPGELRRMVDGVLADRLPGGDDEATDT